MLRRVKSTSICEGLDLDGAEFDMPEQCEVVRTIPVPLSTMDHHTGERECSAN